MQKKFGVENKKNRRFTEDFFENRLQTGGFL